MKRNAIKLTMIAVLTVLVLSLAFFAVYTGTSVETALAAGESRADVKIVGDGTVTPGGTVTVEVTLSTTRGGTWFSAGIFIVPLKSDGTMDTTQVGYFTLASKNLEFVDGSDTSGYNNNTNYVKAGGRQGISIGVASNSQNPISTSSALKITVVLNVASNAPQGTTINFGAVPSSNSMSSRDSIVTKSDSGSNVTDNGKTGALVVNGATLSIDAASDVNTLSALEVGHGSSLTAISAPGGVLPTTIEYLSSSQSFTNFRVKPTASDSKATIKVGKGTNATAIAQNGMVVASGTTSGDISLDAITTPGGSTAVTIVVTPQSGGAPAVYTINVKSNYINLAELTMTSNTSTSGVTKNGITDNEISVPDDATSVTINGRFAGGYGVQSAVTYEVSGAAGGSTTLNSENRFSFTVNNVQNGQTVTIKATAGGGTEFVRTLTVKKYSVDANLTSLMLNSSITHDESQSEPNNNRYVFMLPTGVNQATMNLVKSNANAVIKVNNADYDANKTYGNGAYTVTVTAEAGNVKTYQVIIINRVASAELTKLEMSFDRANWTDVLNAPEFNSTTSVFTKDYSISNVSVGSSVYFRYEASAGATVTQGSSLSVMDEMYVGQLAIGDNEFRFTAASSAGNMIYVLRIGLREGINTISGVTITDQDGHAIEGFQFNNATQTYTLNVPYGTSSLRLGIMIDGLYAIVKTARDGQMERDEANVKLFVTNRGLNVGDNTITFYAVADNGSGAEGVKYTINVTRATADTNNKLESLRVLIGGVEMEMSPAFNSNVFRYTIIDNSNNNTVTIEAVAQSKVAKLRGVGEIQLSTAVSGSDNIKVLTVVVTAENGMEQAYIINLSKSAIDFDKNFDISNISVMGSDGKAYINYTSATKEYTVTVPYEVDGVFINVMTVATTATVHLLVGETGAAGNAALKQDLQVGQNKFVVYAVAANNANNDGAVQYVIVINRETANSNSYLSSILINNVPLANFDKNTVDYVSNQDSTVSQVEMVVYAEEQRATIAISANGSIISNGIYMANGTIELAEQGRTVIVTIAVTIDGSTKFYTVRLVRASTLPVLNLLSIGSHDFWQTADMTGASLDMGNTNTYLDVERFFTFVEYAEEMLTIIAETSSAANVRINGILANTNTDRGVLFPANDLFGTAMKVVVSINIIPIGSGAVNTYYLEIVRRPAPSSSTETEKLVIEGVNEFNDDLKKNPTNTVFGSYIVNYDMTTLPFDIAFPDLGSHVEPAKYEIYYNAALKNNNGVDNPNVKLNFGTNIVTVTIKASDEVTQRTISIIVERNDFAFEKAEIDEISRFRSEYSAFNDSYSYSVGHNVNKLTFKLETKAGFRYEISNNELKDGVNTVFIRVYEEDVNAGRASEALKTIAINVYREGKDTSTAWMVVGILFLVLWVVVMTILILFILKTNKNGGDGGQQVMQPVIIQAQPDAEVNNIGGDDKAIKKALREQRKRDKEELRAARAEEKARLKAEERAAREEAAAAAAAEAAAAKAVAEAQAAKAAEEAKAAESGAKNNEFIVSTGNGSNSKKVKIRLNISGIEGTDVTSMSVEENPKPDKK